MKKTLAIVLALVLVLCASVALADYVKGTGDNAGKTHTYTFKLADGTASSTDMSCQFEEIESKPTTKIETVGAAGTALKYENENAHVVLTTVTSKGICKFCKAPMADVVTKTEKVVAHTLIRGAYKGTVAAPKTAHNDYTHLAAYDQYEAVCSACGLKVIEEVPVYKAHTFATKAVVYDKNGVATPQKKFGNTCTYCGYTRVYKDMTTPAAQKVAELIAAFEAAGMTVEFDADQLIAVGIEEGEVGEVEGCGVATINFSNWTPVSKKNTGKQVIDNGYEEAKIWLGEYNKDGSKKYVTSVKIADGWTTVKPGVADPYTGEVKVESVATADKAVNFNQEAKSYEAAYVTMTVDGIAHRVYFYNRHDKNGWVYAFEADMVEGTYKVAKLSNGETARAARCGAGQEYATVGAYFVGTELETIGVAYETEGYNTSWNWAMVGDFEFVCIGK